MKNVSDVIKLVLGNKLEDFDVKDEIKIGMYRIVKETGIVSGKESYIVERYVRHYYFWMKWKVDTYTKFAPNTHYSYQVDAIFSNIEDAKEYVEINSIKSEPMKRTIM